MKFTPTLAGAMSGSLGGLTASHNKGGQYLRRRSVPTNPNTARQQTVRSVLGGLVNTWSDDLSPAQLEAWRQYAANTPVTDTLGQTMQLSGVNMFVRSNSLRRVATLEGLGDFPLVDDAPVVFNTGEPVDNVETFAADFTAPPGTFTVIGSFGGAIPDNGAVFVFVAAPQTPGTRFYKGPYQLAAVAEVTAAAVGWSITAEMIATAWFSDNVPVPAWDTLFVPLRVVVVYDDGRVSEDFRALVQFTDTTP